MATKKAAKKSVTRRKKPSTKKVSASSAIKCKKEILARAVVDPAFRRKLYRSPETVFGGRISKADKAAIERMKKFLPAVDDIITSLAGEVLCGGGGGCPGLA